MALKLSRLACVELAVAAAASAGLASSNRKSLGEPHLRAFHLQMRKPQTAASSATFKWPPPRLIGLAATSGRAKRAQLGAQLFAKTSRGIIIQLSNSNSNSACDFVTRKVRIRGLDFRFRTWRSQPEAQRAPNCEKSTREAKVRAKLELMRLNQSAQLVV